MFGRRILILVAHPDDEVVGCATAIGQAREKGAAIATLYLTHGCLAENVLWPWQRKNYQENLTRRHNEAVAAATYLGVQPLGWSSRPARHLWRELSQVSCEVDTAIAEYQPDQVWVPAYEGGNPDHDALNAVGYKLKPRLSVLEFAEYNFLEGKIQTQHFIAPDNTVRIINLSPEERIRKKAALKIYASERGNLSHVGLIHECYRPLATYDYSRPPHQGTLWYTRFQWVPFPHPRVDFTSAATISKAITDFLS